MDYDQNYGFTTMGSTRNRNDDTELRYLWQPVGAPREGKSLLNAFVGLLLRRMLAACHPSSMGHGGLVASTPFMWPVVSSLSCL